MQGRRDKSSSFSEAIDLGQGSTSRNDAIDQQICWNSSSNSAEDHAPSFMLPPIDMHHTHLNFVCHEGHNLRQWSFGEPSSSNAQNEFICEEPKREHGQSPSLAASAGEDYELSSFPSMNNIDSNFCRNEIANGPLSLETTTSDFVTQGNDINARALAHGGDDFQFIEAPHPCTSGKLLNEQFASASSSSDPFGSHSINGRHLVEEDGAAPDCLLQGCDISCKRKALGTVFGHSLVDGRSAFQNVGGSAWRAVPAQNYAGSSSHTSNPSENIHSIGSLNEAVIQNGVAIGVPGPAESFGRNVRTRVNPPHLPDTVPPKFCSSGSDHRHFNASFPSPSPMFLTVNHFPGPCATHSQDSASSHSEPPVMHVPLPQNGHAIGLNAASSSRPGFPSSSGLSRRMPRDITTHPTVMPPTEFRDSGQCLENWNRAGGNLYISGNVASTSRPGSCSGSISSSASTWAHTCNSSSQSYRRLTELVHRSLLRSSVDIESGEENINHPPSHHGPSPSSPDISPFSMANDEELRLSYARSAMFMDRHGEGAQGFPYSFRNLSTGHEVRNRLVSEIRIALDQVRRGESFGFEDDGVYLEGGGEHDRHRDMRLDVDSMSYEELLALEERIGNVSTGLSEETIADHLKQHKYSCDVAAPAADTEPCCICREDYGEGEDLGTLECGHEFHTGCIRQWLKLKNLCPICKTTALKTP